MAISSITKLTEQQKELLLSKTFFTLPDNPSNKHFSPDLIKKRGYEGFVVLFEYINNIIDAINANTCFSQGVANKATYDKNDNDIYVTYETKTDATSKYNTNASEITKIKDGTTVVEKAKKDNDGNIIKNTYGNYLSHGLQSSSTQWTLKISLYSKAGDKLDEESQVFGSATSSYAGLMSASDKVKVDAISTDIATALASAKSYADGKVARSNLVSVLGEASSSLNGLMSASDKSHLDALYALLGDSADDDNVVNTINEVLAIFDQYGEGADLVSALSGKVNVADIVDDLVTENTSKPLSANMGKYLSTQVALKANSSDVVAKTFTIAGVDMQDNITSQELTDALVLMNSTTDVEDVMEDE